MSVKSPKPYYYIAFCGKDKAPTYLTISDNGYVYYIASHASYAELFDSIGEAMEAYKSFLASRIGMNNIMYPGFTLVRTGGTL